MTPFTFAALIGALIVLVLAPFGGGREVLDTGIFYVIGLPLGMATAALFAWNWPQHAWRCGVAVALGQCLAVFVLAGEIGNLFPLTIVLFAMLAMPMILAATLAGWAHRRSAA